MYLALLNNLGVFVISSFGNVIIGFISMYKHFTLSYLLILLMSLILFPLISNVSKVFKFSKPSKCSILFYDISNFFNLLNFFNLFSDNFHLFI